MAAAALPRLPDGVGPEVLAAVVAASRSWRGVLRSLGVTSTHKGRQMRAYCDAAGISYAHFRQRTNDDETLRSAVDAATSWDELLEMLGLATTSGSPKGSVRKRCASIGLDLGGLEQDRPASLSTLVPCSHRLREARDASRGRGVRDVGDLDLLAARADDVRPARHPLGGRRRASPGQDDDVPGERDMDLQRVALALHRRWPQGACRVRPVRDRRLRRRRRRSRCVPHPVGPADRRKKSVPPALRRSSCRHTMVDCSGNTCLWLSLSARAVSGSGRFSPVTGCGAVGSALVWGARGRGFKSRQPDHSDLDQEAGVHARHVWRSAAPRYVRPVVSREGRGG